MVTLKSVMSSPVVTVTPESPISEAVALMGHHNISAIVVVNNQFPVGIVTERSVLHLVTSGSFAPGQPTKETSLTKPITCILDADIHEAYLLFLKYNIRHMIVVDDQGMLTGIATETDLLQSLVRMEYFVIQISDDKSYIGGRLHHGFQNDFIVKLFAHISQLNNLALNYFFKNSNIIRLKTFQNVSFRHNSSQISILVGNNQTSYSIFT